MRDRTGNAGRTIARAKALGGPLAAAAALAAAVAGCGGGGGTESMSNGVAFETCLQNHPAVTPYMPGETATSAVGAYTATWVDNRPGAPDDGKAAAAPVKGVNTWDVTIADGAGAPSDGLTMTVTPFMPDHN